jgi:hypothetical protein
MGNLAHTPASFCKISWTQGTKVIPGYKTGKHAGPGAQLCRVYAVIGAPSNGETGENRREVSRPGFQIPTPGRFHEQKNEKERTTQAEKQRLEEEMANIERILIVGGGIAGLTTARRRHG